MNCIRKIYDNLKENGIEVYSPGQKNGECKAKYVVIRNSGSTSLDYVSTSAKYIDVLCYVPKENYSSMEDFVIDIKTKMDSLYPLIRPVNFETPAYYDEDLKAFMVSIQYVNYVKNKRR